MDAAPFLSLSSATLPGWAFTYLVHSTLLMALAVLASRYDARLEESLWRLALLGAAATATVQSLTAATLWRLPSSESAIASPVTSAGLWSPDIAAAPGPAATGVPSPTRLLALAWLTVATALTVRWVVHRLRLRRRLAARVDCRDPALLADVEELSREAGLSAPPRLTLSTAVPGPVAFGHRRPEICLPPGLRERLGDGETRAVLAHEIAHLRRRDSLWIGLVRAARALLFFHPLFGPAQRRLAQLAELACDRWSASVSGSGLPLARGLTEVARWRIAHADPCPLPGLAARRSDLARRIDALLGGGPSAALPGWLRAALSACALAAVLAVTPGLATAGQEAPSPEPPVVPGDEPSPPEQTPAAPSSLRYPSPPPVPAPPAAGAAIASPAAPEDVEQPPTPREPEPIPRLRRLESDRLDERDQARLDAARARMLRSEAERRALVEAVEAKRRAHARELDALDEELRRRLDADGTERMAAARERIERSEEERHAQMEAREAERQARLLEREALDAERLRGVEAEMAAARERLERAEAERRARFEALEAERRARVEELEGRAVGDAGGGATDRQLLRDRLDRRRELLESQRERLRVEQERVERELERLEAEREAVDAQGRPNR